MHTSYIYVPFSVTVNAGFCSCFKIRLCKFFSRPLCKGWLESECGVTNSTNAQGALEKSRSSSMFVRLSLECLWICIVNELERQLSTRHISRCTWISCFITWNFPDFSFDFCVFFCGKFSCFSHSLNDVVTQKMERNDSFYRHCSSSAWNTLPVGLIKSWHFPVSLFQLWTLRIFASAKKNREWKIRRVFTLTLSFVSLDTNDSVQHNSQCRWFGENTEWIALRVGGGWNETRPGFLSSTTAKLQLNPMNHTKWLAWKSGALSLVKELSSSLLRRVYFKYRKKKRELECITERVWLPTKYWNLFIECIKKTLQREIFSYSFSFWSHSLLVSSALAFYVSSQYEHFVIKMEFIWVSEAR